VARKKKKHPKSPKSSKSEPSAKPSRLLGKLPFVLLFVLVALAYLNADHEEFIFDSRLPLVDNPEATNPVNLIKSFFWQSPYNPDAPLSFLTFALNHTFNIAIGLDGFDITTFLIFNVLIHGLNACLVYLLIRSIFRYLEPDREPAFFIPLVLAILFAVHPIAASSVAYIIQRRGTLAATFYLSAIMAYLRVRFYPFLQSSNKDRNINHWIMTAWPLKRILLALLVPVLYWFSFKSKNLGLTLPFAILAIEFCIRAPDRQALKRYLALLIPFAVLCTAGMFGFLWMRGMFDPKTMTITYFGPKTSWGPWVHFLTESRVFVHYWKLLFLPLPIWSTIDHSFDLSTHLLEHGAIVAIVFHVLLLILAITAAVRGYTFAAIGIFWFYVTLIPYIMLPQRELFVEYKTYLPSIGAAMILAEGLRRIRGRIPLKTQALSIAALALVLLMTTIYRNHIYQSNMSAWSDAVKKSPNHARPRVNLGNAYLRQQKLSQAMNCYQEALKIDPNHPEANNQLGNLLVYKRQYDLAIDHFQRAIEARPNYTHPYKNMAIALANKGQLDEARQQLYKLLEIDPQFPEARRLIGDFYRDEGRLKEAVQEYDKELRKYPNDKVTQKSKDAVLLKLKRGNR